MTRQSLEAVRRTFTVDLPRATVEESRRFLIETARQGNARIVQEQTIRGGVRPIVTQYANQPGNPNIESVKLPGPIVFVYDYRAEIAIYALDALRAASPVESGRYRNSHVVLVNDTQVENLPATLKDSDVITITNPVPYARRIEIGKTRSGRDFVLQVPNRIYERVAKQKLLPRFRNVASIEFNYIELSGAVKIKGRLGGHYGIGEGRRRKRSQKVGEAIRAPAIFIRALSAGKAIR